MTPEYDAMVKRGVELAVQEGFAERGDRIVIIFGVPFGTPGSTNNLRVVTV